jgi:transcription-repair coupling factor (superfamily II helicase)
MDRLVCGDVGFGKTEVALRAAAAAALPGKQVAVVAPDHRAWSPAPRHLSAAASRPLKIRVEALSRLTPAGRREGDRAGIADGSVAIAIGTTALAAKGVRFRDLGLLFIDEEQRFGAREKAALRSCAARGCTC